MVTTPLATTYTVASFPSPRRALVSPHWGYTWLMAKSTYGEGATWYDEKRDLWFGQVYFGPKNQTEGSRRAQEERHAPQARPPSRRMSLTGEPAGTT